ncbi:MAG TPA: hypothetical protein VGS21_03470 [Acidimicrobiales bacterium]|nr:hypothetical protein [Acidimicrobiales bacterium]
MTSRTGRAAVIGARRRGRGLARMPGALVAAGALTCGGCAASAATPPSTTTTRAPTTTSTAPPTTIATTTTARPRPTTTTIRPATTTTTAPSPATGPIVDVGITYYTWVNPVGTAVDYATGGNMARTLLTEIRYPTLAGSPGGETVNAPPDRRRTPYPVIVFAHGYAVTPDLYEPMLDAWVEAGYVVVSPLFPDENGDEVNALGGPYSNAGFQAQDDLPNEPYDLAYIVSRVVRWSAAPRLAEPTGAAVLSGLVDPRRLVLAGQSDGATAVAGLAFDSVYAATYKAMPVHPALVAAMSGQEYLHSPNSYAGYAGAPALLVVQSTSDECNLPQLSTQLYDAIGTTKLFLRIVGATHIAPYTGVEPFADQVTSQTLALFPAAFAGPSSLASSVDAAGDDLTDGQSAPPIAPLYPTAAEAAKACSANP